MRYAMRLPSTSHLRPRAAAMQNMGFPTSSAGFGLACEEMDESEDTGGYSSSELVTMEEATMWLATCHPEHWRALSRVYRAWTRRTLQAKPGDSELVEVGLEMLGKYIDERLG